MVICLIGGSGSGKDTQGELLAKKLGYTHISMGGILRAELAKGNPLAVKAEKIFNQGKWVDGETIASLLLDYMQKINNKKIILNGFPRNDDQRQYFPDILAKVNIKLAAVIHLDVPDSVLISRMHSQLEEGQQREDMSDKVMQQRLQSYKDTIEPILKGYREEGILVTVNGDQDREKVHADILAAVLPRINE